jgi:hypothetical protein
MPLLPFIPVLLSNLDVWPRGSSFQVGAASPPEKKKKTKL